MGIGFRCCCGEGGGSLPPSPPQCSSLFLSRYDLASEDYTWQVGLPTGYSFATGAFGNPVSQGRILSYNQNHLGLCAVGVAENATSGSGGSLFVYDFNGTVVNSGNMIWSHSPIPEEVTGCPNYLIHPHYFCMDESSNLYGGGPFAAGRSLGSTRWSLQLSGGTAFLDDGRVVTYGANFPNDSGDFTTNSNVFQSASLLLCDVYPDYPDSPPMTSCNEDWTNAVIEHLFIDESTDRLYCIFRGPIFTANYSGDDFIRITPSVICELNKETGVPLWVFVPAFQWPDLLIGADDLLFANAVGGTLYCDVFNNKRFTLSASGGLQDEYDDTCVASFEGYACRGRIRNKGGSSYYKSYCDEEGNENSSFSSYDLEDQCSLLPRYDMSSFLTPSVVNRWYSSGSSTLNSWRFDSDGSEVFFLFPACEGADDLPTYRLAQYDSNGNLIKNCDTECPQIDLAHVSSSFNSSEESYYEGQGGSIFLAGALA